jgi:hypothetical protein
MNLRTYRHVAQGQTVAWLNRSFVSRENLISDFDTFGSNNITPLTVSVQNQGQMGTPIGVILQPLNLTQNPILIPPEINNTIVLTMTTALMARGNPTLVVAPPIFGLTLYQRPKGTPFM